MKRSGVNSETCFGDERGPSSAKSARLAIGEVDRSYGGSSLSESSQVRIEHKLCYDTISLRDSGPGATVSLPENIADPFTRGIQFNAKFVNSVEVKSLRDNEEVRKRIAEEIRTSDPSLNMNAVFVVKSNSLRVKNLTQNSTVDYLISRIVYCGAHTEFKDRFFFIHRSKHDRTLFAEIYWLSSAEKVKVLTLTIAKAFQISYRGWIADMMRNTKDEIPSDSSNGDNNIGLRVRSVPPGVLTKRNITHGRSSHISRRHSYGDECEPPTGSPAVYKVQAKNELTGSTHDVTLTVDMNIEFRELAESRSNPDILSTDLPTHELSHFDLSLVKEYMDDLLSK